MQVVPGSEMGKAKELLSTRTPHPIRHTPELEENETLQDEEDSGFNGSEGQAAAAFPSSPIRAPRGYPQQRVMLPLLSLAIQG